MKYIIYKITNTKNKKIYIGKHQTKNINDGYFGSGIALEKAIKKYGKDLFTKEILFVFDTENEMNNKEKEIVTEEFISSNRNYNMGIGGEGGSHFKGKTHSLETRKRLSDLSKGRIFSEETKRKISEGNKNRIISEETRKKLSDKAKQRFSNLDERKKISDAVKLVITDETRHKMSISAKNRHQRERNIAG